MCGSTSISNERTLGTGDIALRIPDSLVVTLEVCYPWFGWMPVILSLEESIHNADLLHSCQPGVDSSSMVCTGTRVSEFAHLHIPLLVQGIFEDGDIAELLTTDALSELSCLALYLMCAPKYYRREVLALSAFPVCIFLLTHWPR